MQEPRHRKVIAASLAAASARAAECSLKLIAICFWGSMRSGIYMCISLIKSARFMSPPPMRIDGTPERAT